MKLLFENWKKFLKEEEEEFESHMMFDPNSSNKKEAKTPEEHQEFAGDGYVHVDPSKIRQALEAEGGAAGLDAIVNRVDAEEDEVKAAMLAMDDVAQHEDGDYILSDDEQVKIDERCQKGYKTHPTQKTKEMFGKTYRNCVKAEANDVEITETDLQEKKKKKKNKICKAGKEWAKETFETYPSVYANLAASKYCKDPNYAKKDKQNEELELDEGELKKWLDQKWVRISSAGNIAGECGTSKSTKNPDRCLPAAKARSMTKAQRAATARKKKDAQKSGKDSGKTSNVANTKKGKVTKSYTKQESLNRDEGNNDMKLARSLTRESLQDLIDEVRNELLNESYYYVDAVDINEEYCPVCSGEQELDEKKKKACKPAKGKRFAKRVDGKCRSFGQAGKAKDGGDRIRPGTAKADAYCARSAKIKKCKNPPCANTLSRKKWKCRGSKSVAE